MYIRYDGKVEDRDNGQKKKACNRCAYSKMNEQVEYKVGSGKFYSLLMGRDFKPDQYAIFWDFANKVEGDTKSGFDFVDEVDMDQYDAPKSTHTIRRLTLYILRERRASLANRITDVYNA